MCIGIQDDGTSLGLGSDLFSSEDKTQQHLTNLVRDFMGAEHMRHVDLEFEDFRGHIVLVVRCSPSRRPVFLKHDKNEVFFIRTANSTNQLTGSPMLDYIKTRFD